MKIKKIVVLCIAALSAELTRKTIKDSRTVYRSEGIRSGLEFFGENTGRTRETSNTLSRATNAFKQIEAEMSNYPDTENDKKYGGHYREIHMMQATSELYRSLDKFYGKDMQDLLKNELEMIIADDKTLYIPGSEHYNDCEIEKNLAFAMNIEQHLLSPKEGKEEVSIIDVLKRVEEKLQQGADNRFSFC